MSYKIIVHQYGPHAPRSNPLHQDHQTQSPVVSVQRAFPLTTSWPSSSTRAPIFWGCRFGLSCSFQSYFQLTLIALHFTLFSFTFTVVNHHSAQGHRHTEDISGFHIYLGFKLSVTIYHFHHYRRFGSSCFFSIRLSTISQSVTFTQTIITGLDHQVSF